MSQNKWVKPREQSVKNYKEFTSHDRDKIASITETQAKEFLLSPIISDYVYVSSRALDAGDMTGRIDKFCRWEEKINRNADYFDVDQLLEEHPLKKIPRFSTFNRCGVYTNHNSKDVQNSIGYIFDSYLVTADPSDIHVTLLMGIDRQKAPRIARDLEVNPTAVASSMGCSIESGRCTACGESGCQHLRFMRNGRVNGKKVAEYLLGVEFFEDSIVTTPACHTAYVLDSLVNIIPGRILKIASAANKDDPIMVTAQIMKSIHESIKTSSTHEDKVRLSDNLDRLMLKLTALAEVAE